MGIVEYRGPLTHSNLMKKTKDELAWMILNLQSHIERMAKEKISWVCSKCSSKRSSAGPPGGIPGAPGGFTSFEWLLIICLVAVFALSGLTMFLGYQEDKDWKAFKAQHNCQPVAYSKGGVESAVGPTVTGEGGGVAVMVISRPDRIAWKCDDGVTYWRNE